MKDQDVAALLDLLRRATAALERIAENTAPAEVRVGDRNQSWSIAESLDRIGDLIAERGS